MPPRETTPKPGAQASTSPAMRGWSTISALRPGALPPADPHRRRRSRQEPLGARGARRQGCWIEGNATRLALYARLSQHRDDVCRHRRFEPSTPTAAASALLKCLCQTRGAKSVAWTRTRAAWSGRGSRKFTTKSRVAIISNDCEALTPERAGAPGPRDVGFLSRAPAEVHARPGLFDDAEIHVVGATCTGARAVAPALCAGKGLKAAGRTGRDSAPGDENRRARIVRELFASPPMTALNAGGGCRRAKGRMRATCL